MRTINTCCFCLEVRTGTLILGWLGTVGGILNSLSLLFYLFSVSSFVDTMKDLLETEGAEVDPEAAESTAAVVELIEAWATVVLLMGLVVAIFETLVFVLILVAHYKKRPSLMLPSLVIQMIGLITSAISLVICILIMLISLQLVAVLMMLFIYLPILALNFHFWHCIYSYYTMLKIENYGVEMQTGKTHF